MGFSAVSVVVSLTVKGIPAVAVKISTAVKGIPAVAVKISTTVKGIPVVGVKISPTIKGIQAVAFRLPELFRKSIGKQGVGVLLFISNLFAIIAAVRKHLFRWCRKALVDRAIKFTGEGRVRTVHNSGARRFAFSGESIGNRLEKRRKRRLQVHFIPVG